MASIVFQIVFWISVAAMFHSYILFPVILHLLSKTRKPNSKVYSAEIDDLPEVTILMSVHNEEKVIENKLNSLLSTSYPKEKLSILVGSDSSTDKTNAILQEFAIKHSQLQIYPFEERQGKPNVINKLHQKVTSEIVILTDAKAFFTESTIFEMVKHFKNPDISIVGANLVNNEEIGDGIAYQENAFISREIRMKYQEGLIWGSVIGAYGACFAIRNSDFITVPSNYLVDDFYITMNVLKNRKKVIYELNSVCYESVPSELSEEFRRKVRIATGNFQNLKAYSSLLFGPRLAVSFCFWSHKVLRWIGPFFIVLTIVSLFFLQHLLIYRIAAITIAFVLLLPFVDYILRKLNLHIVILRFATHFFSMNIALMVGLIKYIKGVKSNVWQPTQRK